MNFPIEDELAAANARVKELEAMVLVDRNAIRLRGEERDAANADRARLRAALVEQLWGSDCNERNCTECSVCLLRAALASTDASQWLRERERAVAERVREACSKFVWDCGMADDLTLRPIADKLSALDLDALLGGGE